MRYVRMALLIGLLVGSFSFGASGTLARSTINDHLVLGNPSNAVSSTSYPTNYLIQRNQYAMSYYRDKGIPNWVSWHLDSGDFGNATRGDFRTDTSLPSGWYRVTTSDYTGSGYDRGHMTPSADRTYSDLDNDATFYMTNIVPQAADNNQGPWANLENYIRDQVNAGNEAYIISGGIGSKGTIAAGKVTIPASTWKIVVLLPLGSNDLSRISTTTRVIAVNMPNNQGIRFTPWTDFLTTVDDLEQATGYNFLSNVSSSIQAVIEARVDGSAPPPPPTAGCSSDLFISEYTEGSSNNKAIELFNGSANAVSLSGYSLKFYANGSTSASTLTLSGSVPAGGTFVIVHSSATSSLLAKANLTSGSLSFNGNDAVVLFKSSTVVDAIGDVGYDPGAAGWGSGSTTTTDHSLVRAAVVKAGDTNATNNFYPDAEWSGYAQDTFSSLGSHTQTCP